ncbi:hypothetical protein ABL78_2503 [Leptomonas seymouri]|uniref:Uncharacterized protein n=1 Tax=Leptomonas seymouri TaxID=5684 RepID=A0A0N1ILV2_LEPSE|nr:hypothetical protein ABL78_2503 [Leptomonas seymouri]|eukprot:KPI88384.1 hypothetical protein ABL78_2503 [Leptomonas seymouri]
MMVSFVLEQMCAATGAARASTSSLLNTSSQVSCEASLPSRSPIPSALEVPPWRPSATNIAVTTTPSSSSVTAAPMLAGQRSGMDPQQQPSPTSQLLPTVLSTQRGVARVAALHPTFVLRLLTALLQASCGCAEDTAARVGLSPAPSPGKQQAAAGDYQRRAGYRDAFLQLLHLYAPLLLSRQRGTCTAVDELFTHVSQESGALITSKDQRRAERLLTKAVSCSWQHLLHRPAQLWVDAFLEFISSVVELLSAQSRRVARADPPSSCTRASTVAAAAGSVPPVEAASGSAAFLGEAEVRKGHQTLAASSVETETVEAVWMLKVLGMVLWLTDTSSPDQAVGADSDDDDVEPKPGPPVAGLAPDDATTAGQAVPELPAAAPLDASPNGLRKEDLSELCPLALHCRCSKAESIALAAVTSRMRQRRLHGESDEEGHHPLDANFSDTLDALALQVKIFTRLVWILQVCRESDHGRGVGKRGNDENGKESAPTVWEFSADPLMDDLAHLLRAQLEEKQKQQHRLLAAAERAVQRVLRLSTAQWHSPAMLVALCGVTSYQLHTQLRQLQQRLRDLVSEREGKVHAPEALSLLPSDAGSLPVAQPALVTDAVWSDDDLVEDKDDAVDQASMSGQTTAAPAQHNVSSTAAPARERPAPLVRRSLMQCLYSPRVSSRGCSAPASERVDVHDVNAAHLADPRTHRGDPAQYLSATRCMEHLWELPPRVPQEWTPALATAMACCALCIAATTTAVSHLCFFTGEPLPDDHGGQCAAPQPSLTAVPTSPTRASPRLSLLDLGFARQREAAADRVSPRKRNTSQVPPKGSSTNDADVVGALAQWHLRGLIQQLRTPAHGIELCARGRTVEVSTAGSRAHAVSRASLPSGPSSLAAVPSSVGATGGASWFAAYSQTNKSALPRARSTREASSAGASSAHRDQDSVTSLVLLRQISPAFLLASCLALQHLLRTQDQFFVHAQLGGSTMRELRQGVVDARRFAGGTAGWAAGMLQCAPTASPSGRRGGEGALSSQHNTRVRSLWCDVGVLGQGGDRSITAALDAALQDCADTNDGGDASTRPRQQKEGSVTTDTGEEGEDDLHASAGTCALTEALLVVVSFLGSRVVAVALPPLQASVHAAESHHKATSLDGALPPCASSTPLMKSPLSWCDALQALVGLTLDAHRVHRIRYKMQHQRRPNGADNGNSSAVVNGDSGPAGGSTARSSASPPPDAWRAAGVSSTSMGLVGSLRRPYHGGAGSRSSPKPPLSAARMPAAQPPSLSMEAHFGLGTFFLALVRALLQLYAGRADLREDANDDRCGDGAPSAAEASIAQCVFAMASVINDLLHDYAQHPPAALCEVLAMMSVLQLPPPFTSARVCKSEEQKEEPTGRSSKTMWEALRSTPYWDTLRLGALEAASLAWNAAPEPSSPPATPHTAVRRCSPVTLSITVSPACSIPSPRESLLGHIPCARDPASMSWLPTATPRSHQDEADIRWPQGHLSNAKSLLDLMAEEEALVLAMQSAAAPRTSTASELAPSDDALEEEAEKAQQLAIAVASSRRYMWAMSRLQYAWEDALMNTISSGCPSL